ncbi:MAG TPA: phosphoribosylformylglycinamidine synthase I [Candidatus Marinimicrobia bacterium]|jgi:phosphoribosylformylglycinamidine synthase|nr:phosphoribosylformylglycinamidine synthase I [Candidatus Neomarinimicrobiota bacterium]MEE1572527.1 phosphoribosylformylglycinamidine synthase I [Candidatus Neomarinimicrobiota bacterium]HJL78412.1 phosphoribosylformylglycinamidine synthase I [Candidatus Neomarinimicrobiota bacterium]HJN68431.1 phosphoribosylformylglycinamidine synthase I [Candidatus Neomarinimicrobiota bacterium]|tara:strand:- start:9808 stop:11067 length:1260 start_codon:yes stop_codon:yes gene_type:complete
MSASIAIIQFPGSNTERETLMACRRTSLNPIEFLWNEPAEKLSNFDGFVIVGGFSYEDRSRAGVIAALDPIMKQIKIEAEKGKPVLGICNGAQILVESGLVPGLDSHRVGVALTDNKRVKGGHVVGVGYYNAWANLKMSVPSNRCAFTRHLNTGDFINIPLAHGEGRFIVPDELLEKMIANDQTVYRYCDDDGNLVDEFPTNPNGSIYNIAAVCNPVGNVMAMMPHPERTENGDAIFSSMKEFIEKGNPVTNHNLSFDRPHYEVTDYKANPDVTEWIIDMIIADNEATSIHNALNHLGLDVTVTRQAHWEITTKGDRSDILKQIDATGELYNSNKEFISEIKSAENTASFLVRQKEDMLGRAKFESLTERFEIDKLSELKRGVVWNLTVNGGNFEVVLKDILNTHILFNSLSHECYRIN